MSVEMRDVAPGLWLWRQPHPDWREGFDWEPQVASVAVESRGATLVLDPLAPPPSERAVWTRLNALAPESVVILKPDHVRDVDLFVRWHDARAYGPSLFRRDDIPHTELEPIRPGDDLPGGLEVHRGKAVAARAAGSYAERRSYPLHRGQNRRSAFHARRGRGRASGLRSLDEQFAAHRRIRHADGYPIGTPAARAA